VSFFIPFSFVRSFVCSKCCLCVCVMGYCMTCNLSSPVTYKYIIHTYLTYVCVCVFVCVFVLQSDQIIIITINHKTKKKREDKLNTTTKNIIHSLFFMFVPPYFCLVMILSYKRFFVVVANQQTLPHTHLEHTTPLQSLVIPFAFHKV